MDSSALVIMLGTDPVPWLRDADEPYTLLTLRLDLLGRPEDDPGVVSAREALRSDPGVLEIVDGLPEWGVADFPGHHSPQFLPNHLNLLADMGLRTGDSDRVDALLDRMFEHQDKQGRFESFGTAPGRPELAWSSMLCDTNVITDVLCRFGKADDPRTAAALQRMVKDLARTPQGTAWQCVPEKRTLWRGPGRKADVCPQVTLEGLRAFSHLPEDDRPTQTLDIARTSLEVWRRRADERPYAFGHGYQFKSVKWPNFWYDALWVLETLSRYPGLWRGPEATTQDRQALCELAACLVAYNFDADGRVIPSRTYRGYESFSFGNKKKPSPFATARCLIPLLRMADLAEEIAAVDVESLHSSKGGSGTAKPPKRESSPCPVPDKGQVYTSEQLVPRVLRRHHIDTPWESMSAESVVADMIGLRAMTPSSPYTALHTRLREFGKAELDNALHERRSLVRMRCMRGSQFILRPDMVPPVFAATSFAVIRHAREFARVRGVDPAAYERLAPQVMNLLDQESLTTAQIRERLGATPGVDLAALVNLLACEGNLLRDRAADGWNGRQWTYTPFSKALPNVRLDSVDQDSGDVSLVRAHIRAFGPATTKDTAWWTGVGRKRTDRALNTLGDEIVAVHVEGHEDPYLMHVADTDELLTMSTPEDSVALLPSVDSLMMGYAQKDRFVADALRPLVFDVSGNATSVVLVNGRVAGVWDITRQPEPAVLLHLFQELDPRLAELARERTRELGRFWFDADVPLRIIRTMQPLAERPLGAVSKPLR